MTRVSTVLVADPSAPARAETQRVLQSAGYRVSGCGLGEELARALVARVAGLLRTRRIVDDALRSRSDLEESATHDPLTGLYNQRYLTTRLDEEFRRAQRYQEPLALLKIDLDGFE